MSLSRMECSNEYTIHCIHCTDHITDRVFPQLVTIDEVVVVVVVVPGSGSGRNNKKVL